MHGSRLWRAVLALGTMFVAAGATLFVLVLPAASSASSARRAAALAPRPAPVRGLREARTDRPDRATPPAVAPSGALLPAGVWHPLGPAPIGPPFQQGNFYAGPNSGRITGLVTVALVGSNTPRVVAATAGGGLWTSDNSGSSWTPRTDSAADLAVGAVAADPKNPSHLIAGTGEANQSGDSYPGAGVLVSTNGGATWVLQNPGGAFTGKHIAQVAIDPSNAKHEFAATDSGLYVTSNGGLTWAKPTSATYAALNGKVTAVVINPTAPKIVYFAGNLGSGGGHTVAKSLDGGITWTHSDTGIVAPGTAEAPLVALGIAKSLPSTLYASVGSLSHPVAFYASGNSGGSWTRKTATPDYTGQLYSFGSGTAEQGWYDNVVAVDPTNPKHVLAGGIALVETKDGGATWTNVNGSNFNTGPNKLHPDHHALAFASDGSVWIGDDGGVYHYTPSSKTVVNANGNLNITQFYFGFNVVGSSLLAGAQDNASSRTSTPSLAKWTGIWAGDGGPSAITSNSTLIQFIQANAHLYVTTDAFVSTFGEITPPQVTPGVNTPFSPPDLVLPNKATPSRPTVFYGGEDLYRTTNPTAAFPTWTKVTSVGSGCPFVTCVSALAASVTGQYVYVGFTNGTIEVSTNGGVSFTRLKAQVLAEPYVTGLSVSPSNPKAITASFSFSRTRSVPGFPHVEQCVWSASAATGTWATITGSGLPAAVSRVLYDGGSLIAATDRAVYGTDKPAGSATIWKLVGTGLPNVQVQDLYVNATGNAPGLYAVTHGRGAWRLPPG